MSVWLHWKDQQGRIHYLSVSVPLMVIVAIWGMMIALMLPLVYWLRSLLF